MQSSKAGSVAGASNKRREAQAKRKTVRGAGTEATFIIRVTPTLNNAHLATPTSKAQLLCLNRATGEQAALTFRTRHPGLTPHLVRAAKVRFIVQSLPHLRGSSVDSYVKFEIKYRDVFAPKPRHEALIRELMKKQTEKLKSRREAFPDCFRSPDEVAAFLKEATGILAVAHPGGPVPSLPESSTSVASAPATAARSATTRRIIVPAARPRARSRSGSSARSGKRSRRRSAAPSDTDCSSDGASPATARSTKRRRQVMPVAEPSWAEAARAVQGLSSSVQRERAESYSLSTAPAEESYDSSAAARIRYQRERLHSRLSPVSPSAPSPRDMLMPQTGKPAFAKPASAAYTGTPDAPVMSKAALEANNKWALEQGPAVDTALALLLLFHR